MVMERGLDVWKHSKNPLVPALARVIVTLHMYVDAFS